MTRFILTRIASAIPTLILVSIAVFGLLRFIPGDPAALMLGDLAKPGQVEAMRVQMGLDKPVVAQYLIWIGNVLTGDFGRSISTGQDVLPLMLSAFSVSASIVLIGVFIAALIAVPAGMLAAWAMSASSRFRPFSCRSRVSGSASCCCLPSASISVGCR